MRTVPLALLLAAAPALAQTAQPGMWETKSTITAVEMADMPPFVANMMKGKTTTVRHCLTAEEAAKGPQEALKSSKDCRFNRFSMAGGRYASEMVCTRGGQTTTATSSGSYTPTSVNATSRVVGSGAHAMNMSVAVTSRRTGECG